MVGKRNVYTGPEWNRREEVEAKVILRCDGSDLVKGGGNR